MTRYFLSESAARKLGQLVEAWERGDFAHRPRLDKRQRYGRHDQEFGRADAVIAGSTSTTPNSGTVSIYTFTSTGGTTDTSQDVTAYNMTDRDVHQGGWVQLQRHFRTGNWMIVHGAGTALMYHGELTSDLSSSDGSVNVDTLQPMDASVGTTASFLTVQNRLGWTGDNNGKCYFTRNMDQGTWDLIQLECT